MKFKLIFILSLALLAWSLKGFFDVYQAGREWGRFSVFAEEVGANMAAATPLTDSVNFPSPTKSPEAIARSYENPPFVWHPSVVLALILYMLLFSISLAFAIFTFKRISKLKS